MDREKQIREIIHQYCGGTYTNRDKATKEILSLFSVVGQSEQLAEEKLCRMNQNFVCNCIDDSRCPNFRG